MLTLHERLKMLPQTGRLEWIGLSPRSRGEITPVEAAVLEPGRGLVGDHHSKSRPGGKRQVTLLQAEHLAVIAAVLHRDTVTPEQLRRNLVVSGLNLLALKGKTFTIGDCVLEYSGPCDPCSRMDETFGPGGLNAVRGHGGITAKVISGGEIRPGDWVRALNDPSQETRAEEFGSKDRSIGE
jgi:MOSC domain-containing protein YiiM